MAWYVIFVVNKTVVDNIMLIEHWGACGDGLVLDYCWSVLVLSERGLHQRRLLSL